MLYNANEDFMEEPIKCKYLSLNYYKVLEFCNIIYFELHKEEKRQYGFNKKDSDTWHDFFSVGDFDGKFMGIEYYMFTDQPIRCLISEEGSYDLIHFILPTESKIKPFFSKWIKENKFYKSLFEIEKVEIKMLGLNNVICT